MIKINRKTGEIAGEINIEKAWEKIVENYMNNTDDEKEEETK